MNRNFLDDSTRVDSTGRVAEPLSLGRGVEVTGRVVKNGKPLVGVVIGLKHCDTDFELGPGAGSETSTDAHGYFRLSHILADAEFWAYAKIGSVPGDGAVSPQRIQTSEHGTTTDIGELHAEQGRMLAGRVVCSDGKPVPSVLVSFRCPNVEGGGFLELEKSGRFEFKGLPAGPISISVIPWKQVAPGYRVSDKNKCRNPLIRECLEGQLERDITDLTILLEPGRERERVHFHQVDPAILADFNDAKAGPITGVSPDSRP